jgi:hypothetical protein
MACMRISGVVETVSGWVMTPRDAEADMRTPSRPIITSLDTTSHDVARFNFGQRI